MSHEQRSTIYPFITGAILGAAAGLLLTPKSGPETLRWIGEYAGRAKDDMLERGRGAKRAWHRAVDETHTAFQSAQERDLDTDRTGNSKVRGFGRGIANEHVGFPHRV